MKQPTSMFGAAGAALALLFLAGCGSPEQDAQTHYERGMALAADRDDVNARIELLKAFKYKEHVADFWRTLAGIDTRTKNPRALFEDLRRVVELDPDDSPSRVSLAKMILDAGAADAALKLVNGASGGQDKLTPDLRALKARILVQLNDTAEGIRQARKALDEDSGNIDAVTLLAAEKATRGKFDDALAMLAAGPVASKNDIHVQMLQAQISARKGDIAGAEALLQKMIAERPRDPAYREELYQLYAMQRRFDEAEKQLRAIVEIDPSDSRAQLNIVKFLKASKGPAAARDELLADIKAAGDAYPYQISLADLELVQGNAAQAIEVLKNSVASASSADRKIAAQVKLADIYVRESNYGDAEPIVSDILQGDRRNTDALKLRAKIRIEGGELDSAIADLREALNDQPNAPELLSLMGLAYERSGKVELADRQYVDAMKFADMDPRIGLPYVSFLYRHGEEARAQTVLENISKRNPGNSDALSALAAVQLAQKNWDGAMASADAISRLGGNLSVADQIRASVFAGQNKLDQSVEALQQAHLSSPDAVQPVAALVSSYIQLRQGDKAKSLVADMLKKFPEDSRLLVLKGQTELAAGQTEQATQSMQAAIDRQPKDPGTYRALSNLYVRQKNYDAATATLQKGLHEIPGDPELEVAAASILSLKSDFDGAIRSYEAVLKRRPDYLVAVNNLASLILDRSSDQQTLNRAFSLAEGLKGSNIPQYQDTVGWAEYKRGRYESAVAILARAALAMPDLAVIHYHLGLSYKAMKQLDKAEREFKIALSLEPSESSLNVDIRSAMN